MMSNAFTLIWAAIALPIQNAAGQMVAALMAYVGPEFQAWVLVYILGMLLLAAWMPDDGTDAPMRMFRQIGLAGIIWALISNAATFNYYVTGAVQGVANGVSVAIADVIGGGGAPVAAASFDAILDKAFVLGVAVYKSLPWYSPKGWLLGIIVYMYWAIVSTAIAFQYMVFMLASIATSFLVAFGPLFIALGFFPYTRRFFDGWVQVVVTAVLDQIFVIALLSLFVASLSQEIGQLGIGANGAPGAGDYIPQIRNLLVASAMALIFAGLLGFSLKLASSIAGGLGTYTPHIPFGGMVRAVGGSGSRGASGSSGPSGGSGPGGPDGSGGGVPPRQFAHNRSIGSAP